MMNKLGIAWLAAGGIVVLTGVTALAHGGATGIVGERMMGMMMLSEQVKLLAPLFADGEPVDPVLLAEAATMIEMHAGRAMTDLFPEGSLEAPSEAKPEIWDRWQEFTSYADRLGTLGAELAAVARPAEAKLPDIAAPVPAPPEPKRSEWERLDFASLMGLAPAPAIQTVSIDSLITGSLGDAVPRVAPASRTQQQVFADVTATCSSCHAAFRR